MPGIYARYMDRWERKLATRDTNRVVHPFVWGTDWLSTLKFPEASANPNGDSAKSLDRFVEQVLADSERFYSYDPVTDYRLEKGELLFTSPVHTAYPGNNTARAAWFPAPKDRGRALI